MIKLTSDAYTSSASGFTYSINLAHATTDLPTNVDDEDVVDGAPLLARPLSQLTRATYHIAKVDLILVVRDFIDAVNASYPNPSYDTILALDRSFRDAYAATPAGLRPDLPQPVTLQNSTAFIEQQRLFQGIALHNRLIRLHRAYMLKGYKDQMYAYSTTVCVESSYALLDLVSLSRREILLWWVVLVHVWTAGLVLAADMFRAVDSRRQRKAVDVAISLLQ